MAHVKDDYQKVTFYGLDDYSNSLSRNEIEEHLVFLALKVNGVTIPKARGFPVRVAAEDLLGGKWVKWLNRIVVE